MGQTSVIHGWFPITFQIAALVAFLISIAIRPRRWWLRWLPLAALMGIAAGLAARWYAESEGLTGEPAPIMLWVWIGLAGAAIAVFASGWKASRWWLRGTSLLSIPLCVFAATLVLNVWVGYVQTVAGAWNHLTEGPLPDEMKFESALAQREAGDVPQRGAVVRIDSGDEHSTFRHRGELVYLPPIWFSTARPSLPVVTMIGGSIGTSSDWLRAGDAIRTVDDFASTHGGNAPILAFPDVNGAFNNDTECVNGGRGNAADHVIKDFVPYVAATFGASTNRSNWAVAGWSMGGTCAVGLAVAHPEVFGAFVDMDGDLAPNAGNKKQTIERLFGNDPAQYAKYDPTSMLNHGSDFSSTSGYFAVEGPGDAARTVTPELPQGFIAPTDHLRAAQALCALGRTKGMECAVVVLPGKHDWQFGAEAFRVTLPWLAGQIGVPSIAETPLPAD